MLPAPTFDLEAARIRAQQHAATLLRERLKPPSELTVSEWADLHRYLPSTAAEPGRWRTDRTPYLREIMDSFSDPLVETVVFMKAAQIGGSEALLNVLGYYIDQDPSTILFVQTSDGEAAKFSKERIAPMIRDTPVLQALVSPVKSRSSSNTIEAKEFPGGHLGIIGANAPSKLRARPRRIVLFDEVDGYPKSSGSEGDPIDLGMKRQSTYWNRKTGKISTPTVKGASRIEAAFEESDQRYYEVPCPHCDHYQDLTWENLVWEKGESGRHLPDTAAYRCDGCATLIEEKYKPKMLARGRWVATNPESDIPGFHLNALYSPWFTWREMVREFLSAKDHPQRLRVFVNTRLAETFVEKGAAPPWERLYERREKYPLGICPTGVEFLTAGVDVQETWVEAYVWGWGWGKESWLIDHVVIEGRMSAPETRARLTEVLHAAYPTQDGKAELPISRLAIDTGHDQENVIAWAKEVSDQRVMLVKGDHWKNWTTIVGTPKKSGVTIRGRKTGLLLWPVGGALIKQETYGFFELAAPLDGEAYPAGYIHIPMVDDEVVKQLVSEELVTDEDPRGFGKRQWEKRRHRNEALDCRVYARAAAEQQGLGRMIRKEDAFPAKSKAPEDARPREGSWLDRRGGRGSRRKGWLK